MDDVGAISEITRKNPNLIYYLPEEIERFLKAGQGLVIKEGDQVAAFGFWSIYCSWTELHTIYVASSFRGRGYTRRVLDSFAEQLKRRGRINKIFIFTRVPAMARIAEERGLKPVSYWRLPMGVWLAILIRSRLNPKKLGSHLKHGLSIFAAARSRLFILDYLR